MFGILVCTTCQVRILLGAAIRRPDHEIDHFLGGTEEVDDAGVSDLTRAIWKFFADHQGHSIRVASSWDSDVERLAEFTEIGGDGIDDIPFEEYLDGWPAALGSVVPLTPDAFIIPGLPDRDPVDAAAAHWATDAPGVMALVRAWAQTADEADDTRTRVYGVLVDADDDVAPARQVLRDVAAPQLAETVAIEVAALDDGLTASQQRLFDVGVVLWEIPSARRRPSARPTSSGPGKVR